VGFFIGSVAALATMWLVWCARGSQDGDRELGGWQEDDGEGRWRRLSSRYISVSSGDGVGQRCQMIVLLADAGHVPNKVLLEG
jgi:hypothetical protein